MSEEINRLLQEGIAAAKAGAKGRARELLLRVTELDERNEQAWLWLGGVVDEPEEMRVCLENVLAINPANERARQGLAWIQRQLAARPAPPPPPPPPPRAPVPPPPPIEERFAFAPPMPPPSEEAEEEEVRPPSNRVPCPACGVLNFDFATECVKCSFPLSIECPSCGETVTTETGLCSNCGADLPLPRKMAGVREREARIEDSYRQGLAYLEKKRYQEAKAAFEEALVQNPDHIEARYNLGLACARLGLREEARQNWEEVQARQPDYPGIQKDLDSLLSARDRRALAKSRKKAEPKPKKKKEEEKGRRPPGQSLLETYEQKEEERPVPEEETGGGEAFLYVFLVGLVIGVAYALNTVPIPAGGQITERLVPIGLRAGVVVVVMVVFWILLGILSRLLSLIFRGKGRMGGYMVAAQHFLMPFFLLIIPIVLGIEQIQKLLPESALPWVRDPLFDLPSELPLKMTLPLVACGGLAILLGLFGLFRGLARVGRMAFWKGLLVGLVAIVLTTGAIIGGYILANQMGYVAVLEEQMRVPTFTPTPEGTPGAPGTTPLPGTPPAATPQPTGG